MCQIFIYESQESLINNVTYLLTIVIIGWLGLQIQRKLCSLASPDFLVISYQVLFLCTHERKYPSLPIFHFDGREWTTLYVLTNQHPFNNRLSLILHLLLTFC